MWISLQALMIKILQRVYKSVFFVISLGEGVDEVWLDKFSVNGRERNTLNRGRTNCSVSELERVGWSEWE